MMWVTDTLFHGAVLPENPWLWGAPHLMYEWPGPQTQTVSPGSPWMVPSREWSRPLEASWSSAQVPGARF